MPAGEIRESLALARASSCAAPGGPARWRRSRRRDRRVRAASGPSSRASSTRRPMRPSASQGADQPASRRVTAAARRCTPPRRCTSLRRRGPGLGAGLLDGGLSRPAPARGPDSVLLGAGMELGTSRSTSFRTRRRRRCAAATRRAAVRARASRRKSPRPRRILSAPPAPRGRREMADRALPCTTSSAARSSARCRRRSPSARPAPMWRCIRPTPRRWPGRRAGRRRSWSASTTLRLARAARAVARRAVRGGLPVGSAGPGRLARLRRRARPIDPCAPAEGRAP